MIYILLAAAIIVADQLFKGWVIYNMPVNTELVLIPGIARMIHVRNSGAAFSLFEGMQPIILVITGLFCIATLMALILKPVKSTLGNLSLAMILGGALGNFLDRLESGFVVDMFDFTFMNFAVFNIADIFITFGAISFCLFILVSEKNGGPLKTTQKRPRAAKKALNTGSDELDPPQDMSLDKIIKEYTGSDHEAANTGKETGYDQDHSGG